MKKEKKQTQLMNSHNRRELLRNTTPAEKKACQILSGLNFKYIKQYPIYTGRRIYYADIYIPAYRLVLEIDGGYHYTSKQQRLDSNRSSGIRRLGYHVYRLTNRDACDVEKVKAKILRITRDTRYR